MLSRKSTGKRRGNKVSAKMPRSSDASYRLLFEKHSTLMWVFDVESLTFLAINEAAIQQYSYSRDEFLGMTIRDIRPSEDISLHCWTTSRS